MSCFTTKHGDNFFRELAGLEKYTTMMELQVGYAEFSVLNLLTTCLLLFWFRCTNKTQFLSLFPYPSVIYHTPVVWWSTVHRWKVRRHRARIIFHWIRCAERGTWHGRYRDTSEIRLHGHLLVYGGIWGHTDKNATMFSCTRFEICFRMPNLPSGKTWSGLGCRYNGIFPNETSREPSCVRPL